MDEVKELAERIAYHLSVKFNYECIAEGLLKDGYRKRTFTDESMHKAIEEIRALVNGCKPEIDRQELLDTIIKASRFMLTVEEMSAYELTDRIINNPKIIKLGGSK